MIWYRFGRDWWPNRRKRLKSGGKKCLSVVKLVEPRLKPNLQKIYSSPKGHVGYGCVIFYRNYNTEQRVCVWLSVCLCVYNNMRQLVCVYFFFESRLISIILVFVVFEREERRRRYSFFFFLRASRKKYTFNCV